MGQLLQTIEDHDEGAGRKKGPGSFALNTPTTHRKDWAARFALAKDVQGYEDVKNWFAFHNMNMEELRQDEMYLKRR